jgi:hypothetical protein
MSSKQKKYEKLKHELIVRQQALHFTVIYEKDILEKFGKLHLEDMRNRILDRINRITFLLKSIERDINP